MLTRCVRHTCHQLNRRRKSAPLWWSGRFSISLQACQLYQHYRMINTSTDTDKPVQQAVGVTDVITPHSESTSNDPNRPLSTPNYTILRMMDDLGTGKILRWHVKVGDHVNAGDILCDIDTDIAELEYQAQYGGIIGAIIADVNDTVRSEAEIAIQVDSTDNVQYAQQIAKQLKQK